jgi:hypothetical protein
LVSHSALVATLLQCSNVRWAWLLSMRRSSVSPGQTDLAQCERGR